MKNEVLYLLLNNYADHEAVFLASAIACDERSIKENPKYTNKVVAPTLDVVHIDLQTSPACKTISPLRYFLQTKISANA